MGLLEPPVLLHLPQASRPALLGTVPSALQNGIRLCLRAQGCYSCCLIRVQGWTNGLCTVPQAPPGAPLAATVRALSRSCARCEAPGSAAARAGGQQRRIPQRGGHGQLLSPPPSSASAPGHLGAELSARVVFSDTAFSNI